MTLALTFSSTEGEHRPRALARSIEVPYSKFLLLQPGPIRTAYIEDVDLSPALELQAVRFAAVGSRVELGARSVLSCKPHLWLPREPAQPPASSADVLG